MAEHMLPHQHGEPEEDLSAIIDKIQDADDFQLIADKFRILGEGSRIRIFWLLCHCEQCVTNISAIVDMSSPAVSHHLKLLKSAGLITSRREGKEVYYTAAKTEEAQLLHLMIERVMKIACPM